MGDNVISIRAIPLLYPPPNFPHFTSLCSHCPLWPKSSSSFHPKTPHSSHPPSHVLTLFPSLPPRVPVQCLCPARRDSQSWDTTTAPCPRRTPAPPVWSGPSSPTTWCSTRAEGWATTATAGTRTGSPTPGVSSDRTLGPLAGRTATATRVRPPITSVWPFVKKRYFYRISLKQS